MDRFSLIAAAALLLAPTYSLAADPKEIGKINAEIEDREAGIRAELGDRKLTEMTNEERNAMEAKMREARDKVLEEHGTNDKDFSKDALRLGRNGLKEMEAAKKEEAARIAEAKKAKTDAPKGDEAPQEVQVQKGFNDENPVDVADQGGVQVQRGAGDEGIEIPVQPGE